jgi:hypothetical protein
MSENEEQLSLAAYTALMSKRALTIRDMDIDAFADGVLAHRNGAKFHENPYGMALTVRRLSWGMGWNERALQK